MEEFYSLNPKLILRYQPFLAKRREKLAEDTHFDGWVFGQYFASAIGANFSKRHKYPNHPYFSMNMGGVNEESEEARPMTDAERFQIWAIAYNASRKDLDVVDAKTTEMDDGTIVAEPISEATKDK